MSELPRALARSAEQFLSYLRIERGLAANTVSSYRRDLARFLSYACAKGANDPGELGAETIRDYPLVLRTGSDGRAALAASSTARAIAAVKSYCAFLQRQGDTKVSLAGEVKAPKRDKNLPHPLPVADVTRLIERSALPTGGRLAQERALRDSALLEVLYGCGSRISEACGIDLDDISLEEGVLLLRGKGNKQRVVPLGRYAAAAIGAYLTSARPTLAARGKGSPALFLGASGGRLTRQAAWQVIRNCAEAEGLGEKVSPHTLRHSYATHMLQAGADVRVVQELLGHASVATTQIYTQVTIDSLREAFLMAHPRSRTT
ncbi:site-specific tyrosine recombinase XerD [Dermabacteraceae bacterium P13115]